MKIFWYNIFLSLAFTGGALLSMFLHSSNKSKKQLKEISYYYLGILGGIYLGIFFTIIEDPEMLYTGLIENTYSILLYANIATTIFTIACIPKNIIPKFNETSLLAYLLMLGFIFFETYIDILGGNIREYVVIFFIGLFFLSIIYYHKHKYSSYIKGILYIINALLIISLILFLNTNLSEYITITSNFSLAQIVKIFIGGTIITSLIIKAAFIIPFMLLILYPFIWLLGRMTYIYNHTLGSREIKKKDRDLAAEESIRVIHKIKQTMTDNFSDHQVTIFELLMLVGCMICLYIGISSGWFSIITGTIIYLFLLDIAGLISRRMEA